MGSTDAIKVAILWHMHQPYYQEPGSDSMVMPWVRLHALKDYLDMPLLSAEYPRVKTTYNLVPSLIDQLQIYIDGGSDRHLDLSRRLTDHLSEVETMEILDTFFCGNPIWLIDPYPRYNELFKKYPPGAGNRQTSPTTQEVRDVIVWSNLSWVDPMFRTEQPVASLLEKQQGFTEEEKNSLLSWQLDLIKRIIPTYRRLLEENKIDISFTPYYHPILPLLCDTDIAREAIPGIVLPRKRFTHPEDANYQVSSAAEKFAELFGRPLEGMWPSEGSVSNEVMDILQRHGIKWAATDEGVLSRSLAKANMDPVQNPRHATYESVSGVKLFFRDHGLSDKVGFVYSGWDPAEAAEDFVNSLLEIRKDYLDNPADHVIPIILDGENAWEYFANDGHDFLRELYSRLNDHPLLESVFMRDAAGLPSRKLPTIFAGSWINHDFRIWIGHPEDNAAWDMLSAARDRLVRFEQEQPGFSSEKLKAAWKQIYVAEGSDWCWWYGDEHRGKYNAQFDSLFRRHLSSVYELLGLNPPIELRRPIYSGGTPTAVVGPTDLLSAHIDGRLTHYYEWVGAGCYDCLKAGGAMHRVDRVVSAIHFAWDSNRLYIRLDFVNRKNVESIEKLKFRFGLYGAESRLLELTANERGFVGGEPGRFEFAMDDILELAVQRDFVWPEGFGSLALSVTVMQGDHVLETWPQAAPIEIEVPLAGQEMFWPV